MAKIIITIDPKTKTAQIEADGYTGGACLNATKPFEDDLGPQEGERTMKSEACEVQVNNIQIGL